ncbi:GH92 family glycosyl hydrolase [Mucilaginibacter sp. X5P1]|uniref:GH92 family glycosyl hydrolase n=1 Tax=Mucilaginibacter sp. X5P1 TaxID=2723088 RepID=UPI00160A20C2|nr:GH92 family glycosyl hydrolase [Mucilaginibacter sp. X5P1]MBB6138711.1 putative alpha-1,2-mannosidase [Mucilaginibacter sp. X5P1]
MRVFFLIVLSVISTGVFAQGTSLVNYVNPLSGTANSTTPSAIKLGSAQENFANTIPSVCTPFAMTQWTPQTQVSESKCVPPYYYKDDFFSGFRGSHWISGSCMQDYGSLTIMPITGSLKTVNNAAKFNHKDEQSTPYVYRLNLSSYKIHAAVTATPRCGMMELTADAADSLHLLITPNSDYGEGYIKIDAEKGEIYGYNPVHRIYQGWGKSAGFSGYFVIKVDKELTTKGTFLADKIFIKDSINAKKDIGAFIGFKMQKGEKLYVKVGTSFSSLQGARKNLDAELPGWDFDGTVAKCKQIWEQALKQIIVVTTNETDKRVFYTSFYHAMQHPRLYNDVDDTYPRFAGNYQLEKITGGNYYDDFSLWDIYRAQVPLLEILRPKLVNDLVQSLVLKGEQGGWLPIFPCWNNYTSEMIGDHTTSIITSAYLKGLSTAHVSDAYRLMRQNAFDLPEKQQDYKDGKGRRALTSYVKYGYVPLEDSVKDAFHKMEQVSRTMEYAYDDYALSQLSKKLGYDADYRSLLRRAENYKNVFDPSVGFVRGRMQNGDWTKTFDPDVRQTYITEGTPRQYTFYVPQDVPGLARLMGGREKLETALDSIFIKNEYWHGNEPGHQIPFMYNYTASCWKTQRQVRAILATEYGDGPGGLGGNDDAGQMSAWYMFAAMGFYPLNPISGEYLLCSPIFDEVSINLPGGKTLLIQTHKKSSSAIYINAVKWNGHIYSKNYITYQNLVKGGKLDIYLLDAPSKTWASKTEDQPKGLAFNTQ